MGTRHLICVQHEGKYKVAQYGQWDGYPSGQGLRVLTFLREEFDPEKFLARLADTFEPTEEQIDAWYLELGHDRKTSNGFVDFGIAKQFSARHLTISRDAGGKILELIQDSIGPVPLWVGPQFAADSLFCEWAYVVDLDKNTFEAFEGFNKEPLAEGERFYGVTCEGTNPEYHPVKFIASWPLDALPDDDAFLAKLEPKGDEEETDAE